MFLTGKNETDKSKRGDQSVEEKTNTAPPTVDEDSLPPFNPHNPVGTIGLIHVI